MTRSQTNGGFIDPAITLTGRLVTLVPLSASHANSLACSVQDGKLYEQWWTSTPAPDVMASDITDKLQRRDEGTMVPFAVTLKSDPNRAVGVTTYYALVPEVPKLSIGYTWIARSLWSRGVNPDMKLAMLTYAFDTLGCQAVEIRTKGTNKHSQAAIEKLGLHLDGVLRRNARLRNGDVDDAVVYSATSDEWPVISRGLHARVDSLALL